MKSLTTQEAEKEILESCDTGIKEIEIHILDFKGDLYNTPVEIFFHKKLRNELHFENKDKLIGMIEKDIKLTREYFSLL